MFNFQLFTSMTFVACIFSSSQMALKGLQKREVIGSHSSLFDVKNSGGEFFWNIKPSAFDSGDFRVFAFIVFFFPST